MIDATFDLGPGPNVRAVGWCDLVVDPASIDLAERRTRSCFMLMIGPTALEQIDDSAQALMHIAVQIIDRIPIYRPYYRRISRWIDFVTSAITPVRHKRIEEDKLPLTGRD
jgi:hypothetical protein